MMKATRDREFSIGNGSVVSRACDAFTLIEIMMVVGILGIILAIGVPSMLRVMRKEGMRKAENDVVELCSKARGRAIIGGTTTALVFYPLDRRVAIEGASGDEGLAGPGGVGLSTVLPDNITIEMLDINLLEYRESDMARVRFFSDGRSDEMTLILRSDDNQWRAITLEITTGLARVERGSDQIRKMRP